MNENLNLVSDADAAAATSTAPAQQEEEQIDGNNLEYDSSDNDSYDSDGDDDDFSLKADFKTRFAKLNELLTKTKTFSDFLSESIITTATSFEIESANAEKKRKAEAPTDSNKKQKTQVDQTPGSQCNLKQPKLLSGTTLRDYQLKGVNWLVSLFENVYICWLIGCNNNSFVGCKWHFG